MANAREIADLITQGMAEPKGSRDIEYFVGTIQAWNSQTGENTVLVNGTSMANLRALSAGIGMFYSPGESVLVIKKQTQYFIQGRIAAPGAGAGSGPQIGQNNFINTFTTTSAWGDNPLSTNSPEVSSYIGASRACLVFYKCTMSVFVGDETFGPDIYDHVAAAEVSFAVTGASAIPAGSYNGQFATLHAEFWNPGAGQVHRSKATVASFMHLNATHGLNQGLNTFTMKYRTGETAEFSNPQILVIPL